MRALVFDGIAPRLVVDHPEPSPVAGESLLELELAGVCNTDLEIARGYMGFRGVLGHEFVARVKSSDRADFVGRRVVGRINCGCGRCEDCENGRESHCVSRTVIGILGRDGAFAERFTLPTRNLLCVPEEVPSVAAVFAEPLAAALRIAEQIPSLPSRAMVVGDGKLGALICLALADRGVEVFLVGRHPGRIDFSRSPVTGAIVERSAEDVSREPRFSLVVEASGSESGLAFALERTRPLGTLVLKTTCHAAHRLSLAPVVIDEITIIGSRCGPFDSALQTLRRNRIAVDSLVRARYPLSQSERALSHAMEPGMLKVLIEGVTVS